MKDIVRISVFQRNHGKIYRISRVFKGVQDLECISATKILLNFYFLLRISYIYKSG